MKHFILMVLALISAKVYAQEFDAEAWYKSLNANEKIGAIYVVDKNFYYSYGFLSRRSEKLVSHILVVQSCLAKQLFGYSNQAKEKKLEKLYFDISFALDEVSLGVLSKEEGLKIVKNKAMELDDYFKSIKISENWVKDNLFKIERFSHITSIYAYACALNNV